MKHNFGAHIIFLVVCAFFASWPWWLPDVSDGNKTTVTWVSYAASAMGFVGMYSIILSIALNVVPFTLEDDAIRVEKVRLLPPGNALFATPMLGCIPLPITNASRGLQIDGAGTSGLKSLPIIMRANNLARNVVIRL